MGFPDKWLRIYVIILGVSFFLAGITFAQQERQPSSPPSAGDISTKMKQELNLNDEWENQQQPKEWDVTLGIGALVSPNYEGSTHYSVFPFPVANINWRDRLSLDSRGVNLNLLCESNYNAGVGLTYDIGRKENGSTLFNKHNDDPKKKSG